MTGPRFPHLPADAWKLFLCEELPEPSRLRLEEHLDACAECRSLLERHDPTFLFRRLRGLAVRDEVFEGFFDGIREQIAGTRPGAAVLDRPSRLGERLSLLAGAASVVALVLALQVLAPRPDGPARASLFQPDPCARVVAELALTRDECRDLFTDVRFDAEPPVFVASPAGDLGELL